MIRMQITATAGTGTSVRDCARIDRRTRVFLATFISFAISTSGLAVDMEKSVVQPGTQAPAVQRPAEDKAVTNAATPVQNLPSGGYVLLPSAEVSVSAKKENVFVESVNVATSLFAAIAWPVAVLIVALRCLKTPQVMDLLNRIFLRTTQLTVLGLEIKLNESGTATLSDLQNLIDQVPETHRDWVANSHLTTGFEQVVSGIKEYLTTSRCDSGPPLDQKDFGQFRFTLHVPDVLLAHSLRQLVGYMGNDRGKAGRIFSERHGIIGKAWRLQRSDYVSQHGYTEDQLVELWGMTRSEAKDTTGGKNIFLAVYIKSQQGVPLAVLYADSTDSELFKTSRTTLEEDKVFDRLNNEVFRLSKEHGLIESLEKLENTRIKLPQFDPYERERRSS
jgi:hypothetical protein